MNGIWKIEIEKIFCALMNGKFWRMKNCENVSKIIESFCRNEMKKLPCNFIKKYLQIKTQDLFKAPVEAEAPLWGAEGDGRWRCGGEP